MPAQVLGEFLRFVQRRFPASFEEAIRQALIYQSVFITPPTTETIVNKASELARASLAGLGLRDLRGVRRSPRKSSADGRHAGRADPRRPPSDEPFRRGERESGRRSVRRVTWTRSRLATTVTGYSETPSWTSALWRSLLAGVLPFAPLPLCRHGRPPYSAASASAASASACASLLPLGEGPEMRGP